MTEQYSTMDDQTLAAHVVHSVSLGNVDNLTEVLSQSRFQDFHTPLPWVAQNVVDLCVSRCMESVDDEPAVRRYVECFITLIFHPAFCTRLCGNYLDTLLTTLNSHANHTHLRNVLSHWRPLLELSNARCQVPLCPHKHTPTMHYHDLAYFVPTWTTFAHKLYPKHFRKLVRMILMIGRRGTKWSSDVSLNIVEYLSPVLPIFAPAPPPPVSPARFMNSFPMAQPASPNTAAQQQLQQANMFPTPCAIPLDTSMHALAPFNMGSIRTKDRIEVFCRDTKSQIDSGFVIGVYDGKLFWLPDTLAGSVPYAELGTSQFVRLKLLIRPESTTNYTPPRGFPMGQSATPVKDPFSPSPAGRGSSHGLSPAASDPGVSLSATPGPSTRSVSQVPTHQTNPTLSTFLFNRYGPNPTLSDITNGLIAVSNLENPLHFRCSIRDGRQEIRLFDISGKATRKYGLFFGQRIDRAFGKTSQRGTVVGIGADQALWWIRDGENGASRLALSPDQMDIYVQPEIIGAALLREHEMSV
eukprot:PhF_6_TR36023/c0_g1_i1/m.52218